jgi:putative transcriptional regulator
MAEFARSFTLRQSRTTMRDVEFEWDDEKAAANAVNHGVSFDVARLAFNDAFATEIEDHRERYGEERYVLMGMVGQHLLAVAYTLRGDRIRIITVQRSLLNDGCIMKRSVKRKGLAPDPTFDWSRLDAMLDEERHAAVMADPDARPITAEDLAAGRVRLVPRVRTLRRALRLSQEEFAAQYRIPIGTLRDWEQGRKEPDAAARAYLDVIASEPEMVRKALAKRPMPLRSPSARPSRVRDDRREAPGLDEEAAPRLRGARKKTLR